VRAEVFRRGLGFILLVSAIVLSLTILMIHTTSPVLAGGVVEEPGGTTITVLQGQEFILRFKLYWDEPAYLGYFSITFYWDSPKTDSAGTLSENFKFIGASAYLEDNFDNIQVNVTPTEGVSPENSAMWRYAIVVDHSAGYPCDDNFYVDVVMRASGYGGVPHIAPDNHIIKIGGTIDIAESTILSYSPPDPNITIEVVPWLGGVIVRGKDNAYNLNGGGIPPYVWYDNGDDPPIVVAQRVDNGAFVAGGISSSCRNGRWNDTSPNNPYKGLDNLLDAAFQWMVPGADNVLWYEKYIYNKMSGAGSCTNLRDALVALGYDVDNTSENLTPALLANYEILIIAQWQIENVYSATENYPAGGDPDNAELLAWIPTINDWVRARGGLLLMEGGDLYGRNYCRVSNAILDALDSQWWFQHDMIYDYVDNWGAAWETITDVMTDTSIGAAYETATGWDDVGLYSLSSLAPVPTFGVDVSISPSHQSGLPFEELIYGIVVHNSGNVIDNYYLTYIGEIGWTSWIEPDLIENVQPCESRPAWLHVHIPFENTYPSMYKEITIVATSQTDNTVSDNDVCYAHRVKAEGALEDLSVVSWNADLYIPPEGSNLVVKFYTYYGSYQAENVIWSGPPSAHVILLENARHPQGKIVQNAKLVVTTDNLENIVQTVASLGGANKTDLIVRMSQIKGRWDLAPPEEKTALITEVASTKGQWDLSPVKLQPRIAQPAGEATVGGGILIEAIEVTGSPIADSQFEYWNGTVWIGIDVDDGGICDSDEVMDNRIAYWDTTSVECGWYDIRTTMTSAVGQTARDNIRVLVGRIPVENVSVSLENENVVVFDASASYDSDGVIVNYSWDFGDSTTGDGEIVHHTYENMEEVYFVTLTLTDNMNLSTVAKYAVENGEKREFEVELKEILSLKDEPIFLIRTDKIGLLENLTGENYTLVKNAIDNLFAADRNLFEAEIYLIKISKKIIEAKGGIENAKTHVENAKTHIKNAISNLILATLEVENPDIKEIIWNNIHKLDNTSIRLALLGAKLGLLKEIGIEGHGAKLPMPGVTWAPRSSGYRPYEDYIRIGTLDTFNQDVILHEFAHYLWVHKNKPPNPPHGEHGIHKPSNPQLAWSEGWANFFQAAIQENSEFKIVRIPGSEGVTVDFEGGWYRYEKDPPGIWTEIPKGESSEGAVAGILWDLYDGGVLDKDSDNVTIPFADIWKAMNKKDPRTNEAPMNIREFYGALKEVIGEDRWKGTDGFEKTLGERIKDIFGKHDVKNLPTDP